MVVLPEPDGAVKINALPLVILQPDAFLDGIG